MAIPRTYIGRLEHRLSDVAAEYLALAQEDEKVGQLLISQGQYRHAIYFLVQAMEKYVRCTIFGLVVIHGRCDVYFLAGIGDCLGGQVCASSTWSA